MSHWTFAVCPPCVVLLTVRIAHCGSASVVGNVHGTPGASVTGTFCTNAYGSVAGRLVRRLIDQVVELDVAGSVR